MAFYIIVEKFKEDEDCVQYYFKGDGGRVGVLEIEKKNGDVKLVDPMEGDNKQANFARAAVKVMKAWRAGEYPDKLEWAS